jgi:D-alanine-D-alanine ligase
MTTLRVAVVMGGTSSEREVSLRSGARVVAALAPPHYAVLSLDFTGDIAPIVALKGAVDVVFLALHGPGGEDGRMQGLLDLLGLPYVGTGVLGSAVAMHKGVAKALYAQAGVPAPIGTTLARAAVDEPATVAQLLTLPGVPCVVKPANEGSTIGITIVRTAEELPGALTEAARYDVDLIVEQYLAGVEISVPVLGIPPQALPAVEIVPKHGYYDYANKYQPGATDEYCPARISPTAGARAADYALRAHKALYCRGVSRTDMIVQGDDVWVLETNTLPGLTDTSLLPLAARTEGLSFEALIAQMLATALGPASA